MSYYILPKNNNYVDIKAIVDLKKINIITSFSIYNYYKDVHNQLIKIISEELFDISFNSMEQIYKEFNPHEYIFSKVPGSKFSVSKLKTKTNLFYEFLEISNTLNCFDSFKNTNINFFYMGENFHDLVECFSLLRENKEDVLLDFFEKEKEKEQLLSVDKEKEQEKYDFLFCEMLEIIKKKTNLVCLNDYNNEFGSGKNEIKNGINDYILYFVKIILKILKYQSPNGICIIQINHITHKPIIELLHLITSLFEKTYIIKPNSSNITSFDKYLVCKNFIFTDARREVYKKYYKQLNDMVINYEKNNLSEKNIISILNNDNDKGNDKGNDINNDNEDLGLPYYFMNKIDDINIIIGQQQLECMDQIIHMFKNNNQKERIELIRKVNIQKSVNWCEKFKIPCNKFVEKTNIFLPILKED